MIYLILGLTLIAIVLADLFSSTMSPSGGVVTRYVTRYIWCAASWVSGRVGVPRRYGFVVGMCITLAMVTAWNVGLWMGGYLSMAGFGEALVHSETGAPAPQLMRVHIAGSLVGSVGTGEYTFGEPGWSLIGNGVSLLGTITMSLSISFLIPLIQATVRKRTVGARIYALGGNPYAIADRIASNAGGSVQSQLSSLTGSILRVEQDHLAYPTLSYLNSWRQSDAFALNLVRLDEALLLLGCVGESLDGELDVPREQLSAVCLRFARRLDELDRVGAESPPLPPASAETATSFEIEAERLDERASDRAEERQRLNALLGFTGWQWDDVYAAEKEDGVA